MVKLFDRYRKSINPPYFPKDILALLITIGLILILPLAVFVVKRSTELRGHAQTVPATYYGNAVNVYGILGQKNAGSATRNRVNGATQEHAPGVVVDRSSAPNKVYVVDSGNSRILGFNGIGSCSNNSSTSCTIDSDCGAGNSCSVPTSTINSKQADIVIGQPDLTSGACNGDNNLGWNKNPSASSLCLLAYPWGNNTAEQWQANNIDVDTQGNLYVSDPFNNRVLEYFQPFSTDKTGGKGDSAADFVWGQNDFTSNGRNRGSNNGWANISPPDDHSLWNQGLGPKCYGNGNPAVSVDATGNVWVSDPCNHRILRFPSGNKNANLVIGQADFTQNISCGDATSLNTLCGTMQARVNPATGDLWVLDRFDRGTVGFSSRFLVFHAPFSNGMSAYKIIVPKGSNFVDWGAWDGKGTYNFQGSGFTFNPDKVNYPNGELWVTEHDANRVLLIDGYGNIIKVVNAIDASHRGGNIPAGCPYYSNNGNGMGYGLYWPSSAVSFDAANNLYITAEEFSTGSHVTRYALPYNTFVNSSGTTCWPLPNGGLNWVAPVSNDTIEGGLGLAVYNNQLMSLHSQSGQNVYNVGHGGKMMIWNDYMHKSDGAPADFVALRQPKFEMNGAGISNAIDDLGRMWYAPGELDIFQLPFTSDTPNLIVDHVPLYWADDGTQISGAWITGVAFDSVNKKLYLVDRNNGSRARIFRLKDYTQPTGKLLVDMVIGQVDKTNTKCNQGLSLPNAGTLCDVRQIKFDTLGNLYAVDNDYECHGNRRITVFMAEDLKTTSGMFPNLQAKKVFNEPDFVSQKNCAYWVHDAPGSPVSIAFDSMNHMVIGNDGYYDQAYDSQRELKQLWFYADPVNKQTPDASIRLFMGTPGEMTFDAADNLIIQDSTWNRIQYINLCSDPSWLSYLPNVTPVATCSSNPTAPPNVTTAVTQIPSATPVPANVPTPTPVGPIPYKFTNRSFDTDIKGIPKGWVSGNLVVGKDVTTTSEHRDGSKSFRITAIAQDNNMQPKTLNQYVKGFIPKGSTFTISGWNKLSQTITTGSVKLVVIAQNADPKDPGGIAYPIYFDTTSHDWQFKQQSFTLKKDAKQMNLRIKFTGTEGRTFFDGLSFESPAITVPNGPTESGDM